MEDSRKSRRSGRKLIISILVILLIAAVGVSMMLFVKYRQLTTNSPKAEREQIVNRIQDVVALPDEQPSLSTVVDKTKFTNQTLRARAENGDKLLIYTKAKRLILYRPSTQKVIDMLTIQDVQPASATGETKTAD